MWNEKHKRQGKRVRAALAVILGVISLGLVIRLVEDRTSKPQHPVDGVLERVTGPDVEERPFVRRMNQEEKMKAALAALVAADKSDTRDVPESSGHARDKDEALDWAEMDDDQRAAHGLTPQALYGSSQGAMITVLSQELHKKGELNLAAEASQIAQEFMRLSAGVPLDFNSIAEREAALFDRAFNKGLFPASHKVFSLWAKRYEERKAGKLPSVEAKIDVERTSAVNGLNSLNKDDHDSVHPGVAPADMP